MRANYFLTKSLVPPTRFQNPNPTHNPNQYSKRNKRFSGRIMFPDKVKEEERQHQSEVEKELKCDMNWPDIRNIQKKILKKSTFSESSGSQRRHFSGFLK